MPSSLIGLELPEQAGDGFESDLVTCALLYALVRYLKPGICVEAGTHIGYGALHIGKALRDNKLGVLYTVDTHDYKAVGWDAWYDLPAAPQVVFRHGTFEAMLDDLSTTFGDIDFAYIDASGPPDGAAMRLRHLKLVLPRMSKGGVVVIDDTAGSWDGASEIRDMAVLNLPHHRGVSIVVKRDV